MRPRAALLTLAVLASSAPVSAQELTFHGQVRPRFEFRDPVGGGRDDFTSMRLRAGFEALLDERVSVFVQWQDVRYWGEETNTLTDYAADAVDLHQGYLRFHGSTLGWLTATVGRQETNLGGERLVGAVGWTQQGRSFDGVRVDAEGAAGAVSFLVYKIAEETAPTIINDAGLFGAYGTISDVGPGALDLYWLYDRVAGAVRTGQHSFGARYAFDRGLRGRLEGTLQRGERGGTDVSAYMFGARLGGELADGRADATLWYDHLSGDANPADAEVGVFHTLYATNHKFYGFADLFTDLPTHTGALGLRDLALKLGWAAAADTRLRADLHTFRTAQQGTLSGTHLAEELDLTATHRYSRHLSVTGGFSWVLQDAPLGELGRLGEDMTFVYLMLDAVF